MKLWPDETKHAKWEPPGHKGGSAVRLTRAISVGDSYIGSSVIAGAAAGLVGLVSANWSWVRHRRSIPVRKHRDPDGDGAGSSTHRLIAQGMPPISYGKIPNPVPAREQGKAARKIKLR